MSVHAAALQRSPSDAWLAILTCVVHSAQQNIGQLEGTSSRHTCSLLLKLHVLANIMHKAWQIVMALQM